jgi:hypothetical protein
MITISQLSNHLRKKSLAERSDRMEYDVQFLIRTRAEPVTYANMSHTNAVPRMLNYFKVLALWNT